jgi:hypothetical protein
LGRRGVVWDREGEEGMRVIQRKFREGKGGREGSGGEEGRRRKMNWPPKKFLDPPLIVPIPKGRNANEPDSSNFRDITLSSIFGKISGGLSIRL